MGEGTENKKDAKGTHISIMDLLQHANGLVDTGPLMCRE